MSSGVIALSFNPSGNTVGLPATPKGNSLNLQIQITECGAQVDLAGSQFAFIANRDLSGRIPPPVYIGWLEPTSPTPGYVKYTTNVVIPAALTATLHPGCYYFNVDRMTPDGFVTTIVAGTWPICPVPGIFGMPGVPSGNGGFPGVFFGVPFFASSWQPQLMDQFPPKLPRRSYAY